jgi:hypothetical protein
MRFFSDLYLFDQLSMKTDYFRTKAFCNFFGATAATFVAASQNTPHTVEGWVFLVVGSLGAGTIALKAFLSNPNQP